MAPLVVEHDPAAVVEQAADDQRPGLALLGPAVGQDDERPRPDVGDGQLGAVVGRHHERGPGREEEVAHATPFAASFCWSENGAKRWINLGIKFQPSEFLKPAFAITLAWILSWRVRDPHLPVISAATALLAVIAGLLMAQPDFGSTILYVGTWGVLVVLSGIDMRRVSIMGGCGVAALAATYMLYDNARHRIDAFLGGGTAFDQVDLARRTLLAGGWTGSGLWLGTRKLSLPEAHTDYIFSVIGEEFGLLICGCVVLLYLAIIARVLVRLVEEEDLFTILAASGLISLIGGQAFINILVNLQLFPSKGMTLPLVSYGGSSTIALCLTVGLLLALTRRNPYLTRDGFDWLDALGKPAKRAPKQAKGGKR